MQWRTAVIGSCGLVDKINWIWKDLNREGTENE